MYLQDDDSFASYLALIRQSFSNADAADLNRPVCLLWKRRRGDDDELDVFGAEKYYSSASDVATCADGGDHEKINSSFDGKSACWSSACSAYSRSTITLGRHRRREKKTTTTPPPLPTNRRSGGGGGRKTLLALFRCYCSKENAVDVAGAAARCMQYRATK